MTGNLFVGGLFGENEQGYISGCRSTGCVNGGNNSECLGGLCGSNGVNSYTVGGDFTDCSSSGSVNGGDNSECLGGLCGDNHLGHIDNCSATGSVTGGSGSERLGGLCGCNDGWTTNCYSRGFVNGGNDSRYLGGLCGQNSLFNIGYCYSSGSVAGGAGSSDIGGLCGDNDGGAIGDCYFLEGAGPDNGLGWPLTDTQMKRRASFVGWDFATPIWRICEGVHYPMLHWEEFSCEKYSGGDGLAGNPYLIATPEDLNSIGLYPEDFNKCFLMTADINMADYSYIAALIAKDTSSSGGFQGTKFTGIFDGNNHIIFSLNINDAGAGNDYVGLFGYVGFGGRVLNLTIEDVNIKGDDYVGGLVGYSDLGIVSNCRLAGSISGSDYVSGLVGYNHGTVTNCYSSGLVSGTGEYIGGLIGWNQFGIVDNCCSGGVVSGTGGYIGALIGKGYYGAVSNCYSTGMVSGTYEIGGLMGMSNNGTVINCYSTGSVSGDYKVGGLVGSNQGSVSNCYSSGLVSGTDKVGGLIGANYGPVSNCFWDIQTSGQTIGVGFGSSDGVTDKMTAEMQMRDTFADAGWDFDYTDGDPADWFIQIDEYPILTWQISPADIYTDGRNNFRDFAVFAQYWMRGDCAIYNYYCDWADLDFSGSVDIDDLIMLMNYWPEFGIYK